MKLAIKYLAVFFAAFGIAGAAGYLGVMVFTKSTPEVILPDLVGKNIIGVLETLTRMGLNPKLHRTQFHETIPKYGVCFQDPEPGATIKKGRDVVLYISKGFKEVEMPDLRQMPLKEGLLRLEAREILTGRILHVSTSESMKGAVIAQYPLPLSRISAGSACSLLVSKGPEPVIRVMPDLEGLTLDEAMGRLAPLSLAVGDVRSKADPLRDQGLILSQTPQAGSPIPESLPVQLAVNRQEEGLTMDLDSLRRMILVSQRVPMGFSNRHVRVTTEMLGGECNFYNEYMKPGKMINLLIPGGIKTKIRIFIDHKLVQVKIIDPWRREPPSPLEDWYWHLNTGDFEWES